MTPEMIWLDIENGVAATDATTLKHSVAYRRADIPWLPPHIADEVNRLINPETRGSGNTWGLRVANLLDDILAALEPKK